MIFRYGDHRQRSVMRYEPKKFWTEMLVKPEAGRSDFQIVSDLPQSVLIMARTSSRFTLVKDGDGAVEWKSRVNSIIHGRKVLLVTPEAVDPWMQLNLGQENPILSVR